MKLRLKPAVAGVAALVLAGAGLAATASSAFAAAPPFEPDPNALGRVVLYDASGNVLTGGTNLAHIADYAAATSAKTTGATKATLFFATPNSGLPTGAWTSGQVSSSTNFPNTAAPAPITGPGFGNALVTLASTDANLTNYIASNPNTSTTTGYVNVYQVRITDSGPGGVTSGSSYWETDILVSGTSWSVIDPTIATTTTSISATPPSPQTSPATAVTLNSTVTPGENGTISFFDAGVAVGTPQAVTTGSPNASVSAGVPPTSPPDQTYTAVFTPTGGTEVQGSTSPVLTYHVGAPQIGTSTALTVNPGTTPQFGSVTFTADITEADSPTTAGQAGSVQFFANGTTSLGTVSTNDGTVGEYKLVTSVTLASSGTAYNITAVFTPTSSAYSGSTSSQVPLTVTAPACPDGTTDCIDQQDVTVTVSAGSLTVTTPYTATSPFVLPAPVLNAAGTYLVTSGQFPAAGGPDIVVTSTQAGDPNWTLSVTDTDLTDATSDVINGQNLGLTGGVLDPSPGFPGGVTFTDNPPATPPVAAAAAGSLGLKGGPHTFAQSTGGGNGTANLHGTLTLNVPTSTPAGVYNGTITFSVT